MSDDNDLFEDAEDGSNYVEANKNENNNIDNNGDDIQCDDDAAHDDNDGHENGSSSSSSSSSSNGHHQDKDGGEHSLLYVPDSTTSLALLIEEQNGLEEFLENYKKTRAPRRTVLPVKDIKVSPSFWSVMKNSIGKDLSKIAMPLDFNEPLSLIQRLAEDLEYAHLLDKAANASTSQERMVYVSAFSLTAYATSEGRTGKPFNPLLGETYELVREDKGWRYICEQVSHHPPISACHCESKDWEFWQEYRLGSKFRGQYLKVIPEGPVHVRLKNHNEHYSWKKPVTTIHNIILGKLWIDHEGDTIVTNHQTGDRAVLTIKPWHSVGRDYKGISGAVFDQRGNKHYEITGTWDGSMSATSVSEVTKSRKSFEVWKVVPRGPNSKGCFGFTELSCQLNEPEPNVCPTDSRLRPDERLMEQGDLPAGSREKLRLEDKQRKARQHRERNKLPYAPKWFTKRVDPDTKESLWVYRGGYWSAKVAGDFGETPDIF